MAQPKPSKKPPDKVEVEPGFEKRLANLHKRVLHTPPKHVPDKRTKPPNKDK